MSKHKSENPKPIFDLVLGFEINYQCESSYFNLVRESKHRKSKTEVRGSASPGYCIGLVRIVPEVWWKDVVDDKVFIIFTRDLPTKLDLFCSSSTPIGVTGHAAFQQVQMDGLSQAGILAYKRLVAHLALSGYTPVQHTPGLFRHATRPVTFSLVVDDFAIYYSSTVRL